MIVESSNFYSAVNCVLFHKDGNCVASCSSDKTIKMWDVRSHLLIQHYSAHDAPVSSISLHESGYYLLSASRDSTLRVWDLREGRLLFTMQSHIGPINAAQFSQDGHFFASGGSDELVMVWKSNLYGVKAPEIDWGMGERPASAPTITNGNGMIVNTSKQFTRVSPMKTDPRYVVYISVDFIYNMPLILVIQRRKDRVQHQVQSLEKMRMVPLFDLVLTHPQTRLLNQQ